MTAKLGYTSTQVAMEFDCFVVYIHTCCSLFQRSGAVGACEAHNLEVVRSKLTFATFEISYEISFLQNCCFYSTFFSRNLLFFPCCIGQCQHSASVWRSIIDGSGFLDPVVGAAAAKMQASLSKTHIRTCLCMSHSSSESSIAFV